MELYLHSRQRLSTTLLETYHSFCWIERENEGSFELVVPYNKYKDVIFLDDTITHSESKRIMVVEELEIRRNATTDNLIVKGRSAEESFLSRRIVWEQTTVTGDVYSCVYKLLRENIISPTNLTRKLPGFNLDLEETRDPDLEQRYLSAQFTGDSLYEAVVALTSIVGANFVIFWDDTTKMYRYKISVGSDRSILDDPKNKPIILSERLEDGFDFSYLSTTKEYKNVGLVAGEGEGLDRKTAVVGSDAYEGWNRYELFVDARDIQSQDADGNVIPPEEYKLFLIDRGDTKLAECSDTTVCELSVSETQQLVYGEDYNLGDTVLVEAITGFIFAAKLVEFTFVVSESGIQRYPSFVRV